MATLLLHLPKCLLLLSLIVGLPFGKVAAEPFAPVRPLRPTFRLERYFSGHTSSWGVFETRSGGPQKVIRTETWGRTDRAGVLHFEQDIYLPPGQKTHRSWKIRRVDSNRYAATGTGIIGAARAEAHGNAVHLEFTLDAWPGNPLGRLHMLQWLYLQPDGVTVLNRARLKKAGVLVAEITEVFRKHR